MTGYMVRRVLLSLGVLIGLTVVTFFIARVVPSNPAAMFAGPRATVQEIAKAKIELGLNLPLPIQYIHYMNGLIHGNLGVSVDTHDPVVKDIASTLPATLELIIVGTFLAFITAIPIGVIGALNPGGLFDSIGRIAAVIGVSFPSFWLGFLLQIIFFGELHWLPVSGQVSDLVLALNPIRTITGSNIIDSALQGNWIFFDNAIRHLILPSLTLAAYPFGLVVRMVRASMLEILAQDHTRVLRAMGIGRQQIAFRFSLRQALPSVLTVIALSLAYAVTGTFLIESVFSWPGLGNYTANALVTNDYPAIMGVTLLTGIAYVFLNLVVDLIIAAIDPRVRLT